MRSRKGTRPNDRPRLLRSTLVGKAPDHIETSGPEATLLALFQPGVHCPRPSRRRLESEDPASRGRVADPKWLRRVLPGRAGMCIRASGDVAVARRRAGLSRPRLSPILWLVALLHWAGACASGNTATGAVAIPWSADLHIPDAAVGALIASTNGDSLFAGTTDAIYLRRRAAGAWTAMPGSPRLTEALLYGPGRSIVAAAEACEALYVLTPAGTWEPTVRIVPETCLRVFGSAAMGDSTLLATDRGLWLLKGDSVVPDPEVRGTVWSVAADDKGAYVFTDSGILARYRDGTTRLVRESESTRRAQCYAMAVTTLATRLLAAYGGCILVAQGDTFAIAEGARQLPPMSINRVAALRHGVVFYTVAGQLVFYDGRQATLRALANLNRLAAVVPVGDSVYIGGTDRSGNAVVFALPISALQP
jgi:hypothetical protein